MIIVWGFMMAFWVHVLWPGLVFGMRMGTTYTPVVRPGSLYGEIDDVNKEFGAFAHDCLILCCHMLF